MSFASNFDAKQRVKDATDIGDLVGSYLQLRREGRIFKALCPWHDDSRPSLQINPERQSFKCWVCDIGGDVFSFVMKMEGVSFPEALTMLADRAGIQLEPVRGGHGGSSTAPDEKRALYQAMTWADAQYHQLLLNGPEAEAARKYLDDRGITAESIQKFHLGYSPESWDWILNRATSASMSDKLLERVGLVGMRRSGTGYYDRFRGRVLFPIYDPQNRTVGLGGRVLPGSTDQNAAKYVNSPDTPLFSKHKLLYGLNVARDSIRKTGTVLVMEGYTDCIIAHQYGFTNSVAVLGTALGSPQIRLLNGCSDNVRIVLVLDGDEAGRRRAKEVLELFVSQKANLRILTLPDDLDPCEFLLERGAEEFQQRIDAAPDALAHAFDVETAGIDLERDVHEATRALEELLGTIAQAPRPEASEDHLREEKFLSRLATGFRLPEESLRQRMNRLRQKGPLGARSAPLAAPQAARASKIVSIDQLDIYEQALLEILLISPASISRAVAGIRSEELQGEITRQIFIRCVELTAAGETADFARLLLEFDDPEVKNLLVAFDERGRQKHVRGVETSLNDVLAGFARRRQEPLRQAQNAALRERRLEEEEELAILRQLEQQERNRQGISGPTDG